MAETVLPDGETTGTDLEARILEAVHETWGFDQLRPLQAEAIRAGVEHRDALVVLPTGGGKSLCYQVPPLVTGRMDVVVSPLISLMKDQVDGLRESGYPAAALHSGLDGREQRAIREQMEVGAYRLLFISPERLANADFQAWLAQLGVRAFAIDEAHCISQWGHDFRPEYRQLSNLRMRFPKASLHAYTATATPRVREDVAEQLALRDPAILVGPFDRPNLVYRVRPRGRVADDVLEILQRHPSEATIVYCITRKDTESLATALAGRGIRAAAYHAGLEKRTRMRVQEGFADESVDVVVATVAFGMGIDRSNVRCVIHAAMPKTIEHYQQETGRAGRDGLEAECILLHSGADAARWESLIRMSAENAADPELVVAGQVELLRHMQRLCGGFVCRHRAIVEYFGQAYEGDDCGACDVCLGEITGMAESLEVAQKILSCVYRLDQRFGVGYVVDVLRGAQSEAVSQRGHEQISTYGALETFPKNAVMSFVYQLIDQGLLERTAGDRPVLQLNDRSIDVLRGDRDVQLAEPKTRRVQKAQVVTASWEGVDRQLFEHLRGLRQTLARERSVPAYVILTDATLRELARYKPDSMPALNAIHGIGAKKLEDLGVVLLETIASFDSNDVADAEAGGEPTTGT